MAGLMVIGHLARIVAVQSNNLIQTGFMFVALLAIFNREAVSSPARRPITSVE